MIDADLVGERRRQAVEAKFRQYVRIREARREQGFAPVRCCCDCSLLGWLRDMPALDGQGDARVLSHEAGPRLGAVIVLDEDRLSFGTEHTGRTAPETERAWKSRDYSLDDLDLLPGFERPTDRELQLDPCRLCA